MQNKHNNNLILNNFTIKQLYNNKQLYNALNSNMQTTVTMFKHYNLTLKQLQFVQAYSNNKITKTLQNALYYAKLYKNM